MERNDEGGNSSCCCQREKVLLVKPLTYMNNSGEAVGAIANYYKVGLDDIYIICDDLDLPPGKVRIAKRLRRRP